MSNSANTIIDRKFQVSMQRASERAAHNKKEQQRASDEMADLLSKLAPTVSETTEVEDIEVKKNNIVSLELRSTAIEDEVANIIYEDEAEVVAKKETIKMDTRGKKLVDMELPKLQKVSVEAILNLPPVHCQRDTVNRYAKAKKHLNHLCEEHLFVSTIIATEDIEDPETGRVIYKKGAEAIIDGNTRVYHWNQDGTKFVPKNVYKITYEHDDLEDIADRYYRYDSKSALESAADKVTGHYRENGMELRTRKFASGTIATALKYMYIPVGAKRLGDEDRKRAAISMYKSEIELIDSIIADADEYYNDNKTSDTITVVKPEQIGQQVLTAMMLELKKYKEDVKKRALVIKFITSYLTADFKASDRSAEAVLFTEMHGQLKDKGVLGKPSTKFSDIERQIGYAILCIEAYVSSSNHRMTPPKSFDDEAGKGLYNAVLASIKGDLRLA